MLKTYYSFAKKNPYFLSFGLITAFFGNYGQSFFIAWFGESFQQDFNLTNTEYGSLYSAATLISGFIILYVGGLLDKTPLKKFTLLTALGLFAACIILYFSEYTWHLLIGLFLLRFCGQGLMFHITYTSMARYYDKNRGKAIGIASFGMPLGEAILPALAVILISTFGWRNTWLILGLTLPLIYLPSINWLLNHSKRFLEHVDKENTDNQQNTLTGWTRKQVILDKRFWLAIPAVMSPAFIVTGIFIHQSELLANKNWSGEWFAIAFIVYAVSHLKSSLAFGSLVDQYSGQKLFRFYLLPMLLAIGLIALPFNSPILVLVFMFLLGLTIGASGPTIGSLWAECYGNKHLGAIRSMVTAIMVISTAISPILFGYILDAGFNFQQLSLLLAAYLIIAWGLGLVARLKPR